MNEALIKRIDSANDLHLLHNRPDLSMLLKDCRAELSRKYVPMTDDDWEKLYAEYEAICFDKSPSPRYIEAAVIRRAGLEVQE